MASSTKKVLTADNIAQLIARTAKIADGTYWQVANPTKRLMISGATRYVAKHHPDTGRVEDRFVYYPDILVAGTVRDIYDAIVAAGYKQIPAGRKSNTAPHHVDVTMDNIYANSLDPYNPQDATYLNGLATARVARSAVSNKSKHQDELMQQLILARAITGRQPMPETKGEKDEKAPKGTRSPEFKKQAAVDDLYNAMETVLQGRQPDNIINANAFKSEEFTGLRKTKTPTTDRTSITSIFRPMVTVDGRMIKMPFGAAHGNLSALRDYVNTVMRAVPKYSAYADLVLQNIDQNSARPLGDIQNVQNTGLPTMGMPFGEVGQMQFPAFGQQQQAFAQLPAFGQQPMGLGLPPLAQPSFGNVNLPTL